LMACQEWKPVVIALVIMFARSSTVDLPIRRRGRTSCWSRRRTWERNEREVRVKVLASKMRGSRLTRRKRESNPKVALHSIGSQRMIQRTVMPKVAIPRQPQGYSGRYSGRAHGDDWVSRARRRRWAHHSAASGSPLRGVTRPCRPDIEGRLAGGLGRVAGEAFSRLAAC
jgi:hypothetical protein